MMEYNLKQSILIVDDDENICRTLSAILQSNGFDTATAFTGKEALAKAEKRFFNLALLDIKLPDMDGIQVLAEMKHLSPDTREIMVTGYPSLRSAIDALNMGADTYLMKPVSPSDLLNTIRNKLDAQQQADKITREKLARWVQTQSFRAQGSNFQALLETTAGELAEFGLTKTQAKIYISLVAQGIASASEIAAMSKMPREEVYRTIPKLEKTGLIRRQLKTPRKFLAIEPDIAIQLLIKNKLRIMKDEVESVREKETEIVTKLKTIELPVKHEHSAIEVISQVDNIAAKVAEMIKSAEKGVDVIAPLQNIRLSYANQPKRIMDNVLKTVKVRVIVEKCDLDSFTLSVLQASKKFNNPIQLRQIEHLPFSLFVIDGKEAIWGRVGAPRDDATTFWADDATQVAILQHSFEDLWQPKTPETNA